MPRFETSEMKSPADSDPDPQQSTPFKVELASRVHRLPPYMFGRINALLQQKRRAGDDVIDLGMGNPSDPPEEFVIEKLAEAARDPSKPRLQPSRIGISQPAEGE